MFYFMHLLIFHNFIDSEIGFGCTDKCKCKDGEKKVELEWEEGVATPSYCEYYCSATGHCGESDAYKGEINCYPCKNLDKTSISS